MELVCNVFRHCKLNRYKNLVKLLLKTLKQFRYFIYVVCVCSICYIIRKFIWSSITKCIESFIYVLLCVCVRLKFLSCQCIYVCPMLELLPGCNALIYLFAFCKHFRKRNSWAQHDRQNCRFSSFSGSAVSHEIEKLENGKVQCVYCVIGFLFSGGEWRRCGTLNGLPNWHWTEMSVHHVGFLYVVLGSGMIGNIVYTVKLNNN